MLSAVALATTLWICGCFNPDRFLDAEGTGSTTSGTGSLGDASMSNASVSSTSGESDEDATSMPPGSSTSTGDDTAVDDTSTSTSDTLDTTTGDVCAEEMGCESVACGGVDDCGLPCPQTCDADAFCSDDQSYCGYYLGNHDDADTQGNFPADFIVTQPVVADRTGLVRAFGYTPGPDPLGDDPPLISMALYSNSGGNTPHLLLRSTASFTLVDEALEIEVSTASPLNVVENETYWIAVLTTGPTPVGSNGTFGTPTAVLSADGAFPVMLVNKTTVDDYHFGFYLVISEE